MYRCILNLPIHQPRIPVVYATSARPRLPVLSTCVHLKCASACLRLQINTTSHTRHLSRTKIPPHVHEIVVTTGLLNERKGCLRRSARLRQNTTRRGLHRHSKAYAANVSRQGCVNNVRRDSGRNSRICKRPFEAVHGEFLVRMLFLRGPGSPWRSFKHDARHVKRYQNWASIIGADQGLDARCWCLKRSWWCGWVRIGYDSGFPV